MIDGLKHLFWDFDGTLYDSYPEVAHAMRLALQAFGVEASESALLPQLKVTVVRTVKAYAERNNLDENELLAAFFRYHAAEPPFPPYEGLADCLRALRAKGCKHYLYTHRNRRAIEQLQLDGLWDCFDDAVTCEDGFADKPAPDALLALMARNNANPDECAMIGDRDIDIGAGKNAGMRTILFDPDGYYPGYEADMRVKSMKELQERLCGEGR